MVALEEEEYKDWWHVFDAKKGEIIKEKVSVTQDYLPAIFKPADGYYAGIGCNGRGIGMATAVGRELAEIVRGKAEGECDVPIRRVRKIIGYSLRRPGVAVGVWFNRALDTVERRLSR